VAATWKIITARRTTSTGGKSDVITNASWSCMDMETVSGVDHWGSHFGITQLGALDTDNFTAFASITEANIITWVKAVLDGTTIKDVDGNSVKELDWIVDSIAAQITASKATPVTKTGLPF
tara:strand:- start:609 stop:971 length:363 start_codon:yes stop_codon:yes gene_type:complete